MHKLLMLCAFVGCTSSHSQYWDPSYTEVGSGPLVFSPATDSIDKFHVEDIGEPGIPELIVFHESTIGTGNCSMLTLADGADGGTVTWGFRTPDGKSFDQLDLSALVSVDPRGGTADAYLSVQAAGQTFELSQASASGVLHPDVDAFNQLIQNGDVDALNVTFLLANTDDTSPLDHIFAQALRQCPGDAAPFELDNASSSQQ